MNGGPESPEMCLIFRGLEQILPPFIREMDGRPERSEEVLNETPQEVLQ